MLASVKNPWHSLAAKSELLTYVVCGNFDDGRFHEVVGEDEGPLLQSVQQHGGRVRLLRAVHVVPRLQGLWSQDVIHCVHDSLRPEKTNRQTNKNTWVTLEQRICRLPYSVTVHAGTDMKWKWTLKWKYNKTEKALRSVLRQTNGSIARDGAASGQHISLLGLSNNSVLTRDLLKVKAPKAALPLNSLITSFDIQHVETFFRFHFALWSTGTPVPKVTLKQAHKKKRLPVKSDMKFEL